MADLQCELPIELNASKGTQVFLSTSTEIRNIRKKASRFNSMTDAQIKSASLELKYAAMQGQLFSRFSEVCGIVTEAVRRCTGKNYYDVQLLGGLQMARGSICEMKTGEGKTLTAAIPAYFFGLSGLGMHVVTVNDYLAARDLEILKPVYDLLGLSSAAIVADMPPEERAANYLCDITYGTAKEFGFDFLRDRMKKLSSPNRKITRVQRRLHAVLIDEADSILLDEARTPLIIGVVDLEETQRRNDCFRWAAELAPSFVEGKDFTFDERTNAVDLTARGFQKMGRLPYQNGVLEVSTLELTQYVERAILVLRNFACDRHYTIEDGEIAIVDESTGRLAEGRQWQDGIHQSIEAREGLEIKPMTQSAASVTMQHLFRLYQHVCGMTGTALTSKREIKKVYGKRVVQIPTNRPVRRQVLKTRVFTDVSAKFNAVADETKHMLQNDRSVLIGTQSVDQSEMLSRTLEDHGIQHTVLNARNLTEEAEIVALAGQPGAVTVATNVAGRGTDIHLHPNVRKAGGLHVIMTGIHESERIDLQLIGRCSRQGDPGSYSVFVAMDDEILRSGFGEIKAAEMRKRFSVNASNAGELLPKYFRFFRRAQAKLERRHKTDRLALLRRDYETIQRMYQSGQDFYLDAIR